MKNISLEFSPAEWMHIAHDLEKAAAIYRAVGQYVQAEQSATIAAHITVSVGLQSPDYVSHTVTGFPDPRD